MIYKNIDTGRSSSSRGDGLVSSWQRILLVICMAASVASGVGAYAFLSATRPVANRVSWSLQPPKSESAAARVAATASLQAAATLQRRHMREM